MTFVNPQFYGGISACGKHHVLVIDGEDWRFGKGGFISETFRYTAIGTVFDLETVKTDEGDSWSLNVEWETLNIRHGTLVDDEVRRPYVIATEAQKKNRSLASAKKKMGEEALMDCTIGDLKEAARTMTKAQRAALIALIISEVGA